jgi:hypothetical protein
MWLLAITIFVHELGPASTYSSLTFCSILE